MKHITLIIFIIINVSSCQQKEKATINIDLLKNHLELQKKIELCFSSYEDFHIIKVEKKVFISSSSIYNII